MINKIWQKLRGYSIKKIKYHIQNSSCFLSLTLNCHPREGGDPVCNIAVVESWIPAFAGMTIESEIVKVT
jgi:hypothetical protein